MKIVRRIMNRFFAALLAGMNRKKAAQIVPP
jgi:hypothetical protein